MAKKQKRIEIDVKLIVDVYNLITSSSKIDWDDFVTTRLYKVLKKEGVDPYTELKKNQRRRRYEMDKC